MRSRCVNPELAGVKGASWLALAWQVRPDCLSPSARSSINPPVRLRLHWPSPVDAQDRHSLDFAGILGRRLQHDPPQRPQRLRWRNGAERRREGAAPDLGGTSPAPLPPHARLGIGGQTGSILRAEGQQDVTRTDDRARPRLAAYPAAADLSGRAASPSPGHDVDGSITKDADGADRLISRRCGEYGVRPPRGRNGRIACLYCEPDRDIVDDPRWAGRARGRGLSILGILWLYHPWRRIDRGGMEEPRRPGRAGNFY
jgi:hypothetical protein